MEFFSILIRTYKALHLFTIPCNKPLVPLNRRIINNDYNIYITSSLLCIFCYRAKEYYRFYYFIKLPIGFGCKVVCYTIVFINYTRVNKFTFSIDFHLGQTVLCPPLFDLQVLVEGLRIHHHTNPGSAFLKVLVPFQARMSLGFQSSVASMALLSLNKGVS